MKKALMIMDEQEWFYDWYAQTKVYGRTLTIPSEAEKHLGEVSRLSAAAFARGVPTILVELPGEAGPTKSQITHNKVLPRYVKAQRVQMDAFEGGYYFPVGGLKRKADLAEILESEEPIDFAIAGLFAGDCVKETARSLAKLPNVTVFTASELLLDGFQGRQKSTDMFYEHVTDYLGSVDAVIDRLLQ